MNQSTVHFDLRNEVTSLPYDAIDLKISNEGGFHFDIKG